MEKSDQLVDVLAYLGESVLSTQDIYLGVEKFVCVKYRKAHMKCVVDVLYADFQHNYATRKNDDPLVKIKGVNPSSMSPCQYIIYNKVLRTNYVSYIWRNVHLKNPQSVQHEDLCWNLVDGKYQIKWFDCY